MNNEPVAWINKTGNHGYLEWDKDDEVDESIPLYTHPVNTCKHGVDDGACKECYIEVTHPAELTDEEIAVLIAPVPIRPLYEDLVLFARAILRKAQENG